jgi:hypothetical protein
MLGLFFTSMSIIRAERERLKKPLLLIDDTIAL